MVRDQIDLAHFPASYGFGPNAKTKTVVTLQDEINIMPLLDIYRGHKKNISTMAMMSYIHFCTKYSLKRTNILITVSQYSKNQILRFSGMNPDSILVIPHACPNDIHRVEDEAILHDVRDRLNLSKKFILAEAFKNPAVLVKAYNLLPESVKENLEIVFFSRSPNVLPIVNEAVEMGFAQLLIRPPRRDLSALYSMALVFVFPSWIEGFGIPLLEAMTCGAPIIASNRGSIPEVVGDAGIIIDAEDEMTLAQNIRMLYESEGEQEYYRLLGFNRINEFSWSKISQQVINAYQKAIYT
jgi:glycosyltransferase involved in cell wall biosynthesis